MADTDNSNNNLSLADFGGYPMGMPQTGSASAYQAARGVAQEQQIAPTPSAAINVPSSAYGQANPQAQQAPNTYNPMAQQSYVQNGQIPAIAAPPPVQLLPTEDSPEMKAINDDRRNAAAKAIHNHVAGVEKGSKLGAIAKLGGLALMGAGIATANPFIAIGGSGLIRGQAGAEKSRKAKEEAQYQEALKTIKELDEHQEKFGLEPVTKNNETIGKSYDRQLEAHKAAEADKKDTERQKNTEFTQTMTKDRNAKLDLKTAFDQDMAEQKLGLSKEEFKLNQQNSAGLQVYRQAAIDHNNVMEQIDKQKAILEGQKPTFDNLKKMADLEDTQQKAKVAAEENAQKHNIEVGRLQMEWQKNPANQGKQMPVEYGQFIQVNPQDGRIDLMAQMQQAAGNIQAAGQGMQNIQPSAPRQIPPVGQAAAPAQALPPAPTLPSLAGKPKVVAEKPQAAPKEVIAQVAKKRGISDNEAMVKAWAYAKKQGYTYSEFRAKMK